MAVRRRADTSPITFLAALVPAGRKALTLDADGEATLTLIIPATDAPLLMSQFPRLMDCSFRVTFTSE